MRIAYIYDAVYPWEAGGVQKRVWEVSRRLADDHDVHWYGLHYWDGADVVSRDGVTLHGVAEPQELYVDGRRSFTEAISFAVRLLPPLLRKKFDIIDCQVFPYFSCYTAAAKAALDSPSVVFTWHEVWRDYWIEYLGRKGHLGRYVERGVAALPGEHVVVSKRTGRELGSLGGHDPVILPNGIDIREIERAPTASERVDVLFVGRLIPEKNPGQVIRAGARLKESDPSVQCRLVGEGPAKNDLNALIARRGLQDNVKILPFQESYEDILALMKAADVFVLPSHREGFGITVLEALACGTPVVTADHPSNAATELISSGTTGFITDSDPEQIASSVEQARSLRPEDCIEAAKEYDWDVIAERTAAVYNQLI